MFFNIHSYRQQRKKTTQKVNGVYRKNFTAGYVSSKIHFQKIISLTNENWMIYLIPFKYRVLLFKTYTG